MRLKDQLRAFEPRYLCRQRRHEQVPAEDDIDRLEYCDSQRRDRIGSPARPHRQLLVWIPAARQNPARAEAAQ